MSLNMEIIGKIPELTKIKKWLAFALSFLNVVFLWAIIFVICCSIYTSYTWGTVSLPQLLFFIQSGVSDGIELSLLLEIVGYCLILPVILTASIAYGIKKINNGKLLWCNRLFFGGYLVFLWFAVSFCMDLTADAQYVFYTLLFVFYLINQCRSYGRVACSVNLLLSFQIVFIVIKVWGSERLVLSVFDFRETDYYARNYVPVNVGELSNNRRRNIIIIFGESLEKEYLTLNDNHQIFTVDDNDAVKFANFTEGYSQRWTQGALFSAFTGVHIHYLSDFFRYKLYDKLKYREGKDRILMISNYAGQDFDFNTPNINYLGDITKAFGYQNLFVQGGSLAFSGTDKFLFEHGFNADNVYDLNTFKNSEDAIKGKYWWGVSDKTIFDFFKNKLLELDKNKPFFAVLFTLDLHRGNNPFFRNEDELKRATIHNFNDFVHWFKVQDFYDNTTLIILADHKRMGKDVQAGGDLYNAFFNLPPNLKQNINVNRSFNQIDIFPTVLEIAGFNLSQRKAGVGVSLFAKDKTLAENLQYSEQENVFSKIDRFYQKVWLNDELFFSPFIQGLFLLNTPIRDKVIAHAGGCINKHCYLNNLKALQISAQRGYKYIELDLLKTVDNRIIAAHDWFSLAQQLGVTAQLSQTSLADIKALCIEKEDCNLLDDESILTFFEAHPDIYFVTDKIDDFELLSEKFGILQSRMVVEVFSEDKYKQALENGFSYVAYNVKNNKDFELVLKNKYKLVTMNLNFARSHEDKVKELRNNGVLTLLYSVRTQKDIHDNGDIGDVFYYNGEENLI